MVIPTTPATIKAKEANANVASILPDSANAVESSAAPNASARPRTAIEETYQASRSRPARADFMNSRMEKWLSRLVLLQ